jgi:hypothetical protein
MCSRASGTGGSLVTCVHYSYSKREIVVILGVVSAGTPIFDAIVKGCVSLEGSLSPSISEP